MKVVQYPERDTDKSVHFFCNVFVTLIFFAAEVDVSNVQHSMITGIVLIELIVNSFKNRF